MKKFTIYIATMLAMLMVASCAQEEVETIVEQQRKLTLTFNMEDSRSRALAEDELNLAENKVDRADVFFFKNNGTYMFHQLGLVPSQPTQANDGSWKMNVNVTVPSGITFNGDPYKVYVVANAQVASDGLVEKVTNLDAGATIDKLQALTFTSALETQITADTRFIMDGVNEVTITDKQEVGGEISLIRAAAKVVLNLEVFQEITGEDGETYVPQPNSVLVTYHNGVKTFGITPATYFNAEDWQGAAISETPENGIYQIAIDPFYTYPTSWDEESDNEPYMMLQMNWGVQSGSDIDYVPYYYRIPVNRKFRNDDGDLALERNNAYLINLQVGVLGSTDPGQVVTLESEYEIMDWGALPINTEVRDYKYLVVDEHEVEIFNKNSYEIAFSSSHPITLEIVSIAKWDYSTAKGTELIYQPGNNKAVVSAGKTPNSGNRKLLTDCKIEESTNGKHIVLTHELINKDANTSGDTDGNGNRFDDHDYVPYVIEVKVTNGFYTEYITYTQYPEVYVKAYLNSDYGTGRGNNDYYGGVYVNGAHGQSNADYGGAQYLGSAPNANPNMYVITTTVLDEKSTYLIGDPRETTEDLILNNGRNWSTTAPATYDGTRRQLKYYYPTNDSGDTENMIAPKFRIASSYGVTNAGSYENMKRRCASYQEDGYPAGRWRMPTKAELEYVVRLSAEGKIPQLFNDEHDSNNRYWCASGVARPQSNGTVTLSDGTNGSNSYVRCVYDDWYWGSEPVITSANRSPFTWGDEPK